MPCRKINPKIKNGQSTLEYTIILVMVVAAIIAVGVVFKPNLSGG